MPVAQTKALALQGLTGSVVDVEASISSGLPAFALIGLPDAALSEASDRVKAAATNSGCSLSQQHIVVNLSPAWLPKQGAGFDLAIALAALAAAGTVSAASVSSSAHLGELALDGRVRPVLGVLPAVHAAAAAGIRRMLVPAGNAAEARLVPGIDVIPVSSLREAAIRHGAELDPVPVEVLEPAVRSSGDESSAPELSDIVGNEDAVTALIAAAAGGHNAFFVGPPGAGKTMLAERLPGLMPDLDDDAAIEVSSVRSLTELGAVTRLERRPPFEAPHHTASAAALVGGGSGRIRPGAAVRASRGVLFLDESPEFARTALDSLRQPLESGVITITRVSARADFPARFQLVLAANPCPCGHFGEPDVECRCAPNARLRYLGRLSGPLLDRVDIRLTVPRMTAAQLRRGDEARAMTTAEARARVEQAQGAARERLRGTGWRRNSEVSASWLMTRRNRLPRQAMVGLERAVDRGEMTMRGFHRTLRLAWTLADLAGRDAPGSEDIGSAAGLRQGAVP